jgi:microcystin-dependent protein
MEPFIGQIIMFGGNFAPKGWALCDGQLLQIVQNTALFSILGTTYGGDGRTTFALPDLRGRVPLHPGNGPGLTPRSLGEKAGAEAVTLSTGEMPTHNHLVKCSPLAGNNRGPTDQVPAAHDDQNYRGVGSDTMAAAMIHDAGGGAAHTNVQPFLGVNFIIALVGVYPSRN